VPQNDAAPVAPVTRYQHQRTDSDERCRCEVCNRRAAEESASSLRDLVAHKPTAWELWDEGR
jgi:hypothetical protein